MSTFSISYSSDVSEKALLERYLFSDACPISFILYQPKSSQVRVVQHKQTRDLYALKYINKTKCVRMKAVANVIQERRLLEEVCPALLLFPFTSDLAPDRPSFRCQSTIRLPRR